MPFTVPRGKAMAWMARDGDAARDRYHPSISSAPMISRTFIPSMGRRSASGSADEESPESRVPRIYLPASFRGTQRTGSANRYSGVSVRS